MLRVGGPLHFFRTIHTLKNVDFYASKRRVNQAPKCTHFDGLHHWRSDSAKRNIDFSSSDIQTGGFFLHPLLDMYNLGSPSQNAPKIVFPLREEIKEKITCGNTKEVLSGHTVKIWDRKKIWFLLDGKLRVVYHFLMADLEFRLKCCRPEAKIRKKRETTKMF